MLSRNLIISYVSQMKGRKLEELILLNPIRRIFNDSGAMRNGRNAHQLFHDLSSGEVNHPINLDGPDSDDAEWKWHDFSKSGNYPSISNVNKNFGIRNGEAVTYSNFDTSDLKIKAEKLLIILSWDGILIDCLVLDETKREEYFEELEKIYYLAFNGYNRYRNERTNPQTPYFICKIGYDQSVEFFQMKKRGIYYFFISSEFGKPCNYNTVLSEYIKIRNDAIERYNISCYNIKPIHLSRTMDPQFAKDGIDAFFR